MALVEAVILLAALIVISNIISHYVVAVPISLIQAGLGLLIALVFDMAIPLKTDWFMLLFAAPLLFNDGRHFPPKDLWAMRGPIIGNAIGLVFVTTGLGGAFIHWLVPSIPLAAAFALAAILSPTDPVAVHSLANRVHLPKNVLNLINGESLINDASGLIGFKYGIAAAATGVFVWQQATVDFFYISIVGAIAGALLMLALNALRLWLLQQGLNDVVLHTVLQILTPFLIYMVVEGSFHASGVIAVVVAGLLNNARSNRYVAALPDLKLVTERTWDIMVYMLNGFIFLILGIELPVAMRAAIQSNHINTWQAVRDVVLVYLVIMLVRIVWIFSYNWFNRKTKVTREDFRTALLGGIAGVRGAVTLAGVLAVPTVLADGSPFPGRAIMLFIAAGFVVFSLLVAVVTLPLVTKSAAPLAVRGTIEADAVAEAQTSVRQLTTAQARRFMYQMAVRRLESERRSENQQPVLALITEYQELMRRIDQQSGEQSALPEVIQDEVTLRLVGLRGELAALADMNLTDRNRRALTRRIQKRISMLEASVDKSEHFRLKLAIARQAHRISQLWLRLLRRNPRYELRMQEMLVAEKELHKAGLKALSAFLKAKENRDHHFNRQVIYALIVEYRMQIENAKAAVLHRHKSLQYEKESLRLRRLALAAERAAVHELFEQGYVTSAMAGRLTQAVNSTENALALTQTEEELH